MTQKSKSNLTVLRLCIFVALAFAFSIAFGSVCIYFASSRGANAAGPPPQAAVAESIRVDMVIRQLVMAKPGDLVVFSDGSTAVIQWVPQDLPLVADRQVIDEQLYEFSVSFADEPIKQMKLSFLIDHAIGVIPMNDEN